MLGVLPARDKVAAIPPAFDAIAPDVPAIDRADFEALSASGRDLVAAYDRFARSAAGLRAAARACAGI